MLMLVKAMPNVIMVNVLNIQALPKQIFSLNLCIWGKLGNGGLGAYCGLLGAGELELGVLETCTDPEGWGDRGS